MQGTSKLRQSTDCTI